MSIPLILMNALFEFEAYVHKRRVEFEWLGASDWVTRPPHS